MADDAASLPPAAGRTLAATGSPACCVALVALGFELFENDPAGLGLIGICLLGLTVVRLAFARTRHPKNSGEVA